MKVARFKEVVSNAKTEALKIFKSDPIYQDIYKRAEKLAVKQIRANQSSKETK